MCRRHRLAPLLSLFLIAPAATRSQESQPVIFDTVDVEIVNVEVVVTDKKGRPIQGLGRDDFLLLVDGEEVPISNFYAEVEGRPVDTVPAAPVALADSGPATGAGEPPARVGAGSVLDRPARQKLYLMILVDSLHLRPIHRRQALSALRSFVADHLADGDAVALASLERSLELHDDFSSDRQTLAAILDRLETTASADFTVGNESRILSDEVSDVNNTGGNPRLDGASIDNAQRSLAQARLGNARASLDVLRRLIATLAGVPGRKALVHVSDGLDVDDGRIDLLQSFEELGRLANASRVTLYAIDATSDHRALGRTAETTGSIRGAFPRNAELEIEENDAREPLELTATTTGGRRLQMSSRLGAELAELAADFTSFYSLAFSTADHDATRSHRIEVKLRGQSKGLRVRHRDSYRPKPRDDRSAEAAMAALLYDTVDNPLAVTLEPGAAEPRDGGRTSLPVVIKVPFQNLVLMPADGVHQAQVSVFYSVRNAAGDARQVRKLAFRLSVPDAKLQHALQGSATYTLALDLAPDDRLAIVGVRDDLGASESLLRLDVGS